MERTNIRPGRNDRRFDVVRIGPNGCVVEARTARAVLARSRPLGEEQVQADGGEIHLLGCLQRTGDRGHGSTIEDGDMMPAEGTQQSDQELLVVLVTQSSGQDVRRIPDAKTERLAGEVLERSCG